MTFGFSQMTNAFTDAFAAIDFKGAKFGFKKSVFPSLLYLFFIAKYTDWQPGINEILKKPLGIQKPEPSLLAQDTQAPFPSFVYFFLTMIYSQNRLTMLAFQILITKAGKTLLNWAGLLSPCLSQFQVQLTVSTKLIKFHEDLDVISDLWVGALKSGEDWGQCPLFVLSFSCASFPAIKLLCSRGNEALREHEATSQNWCKIFQ